MFDFIDRFTKSQRVYIIPTKNGLIFLANSVLIITIGLIYSNNLSLTIGFTCLILFLLMAVITNNNLSGFDINQMVVNPTFSGQDISGQISITNHSKNEKLAIQIEMKNSQGQLLHSSLDKISNEKNQKQSILIAPKKRGFYQFNKIRLFTTFPLGFFYAWKPIREYKILFHIWPEKKGFLPRPIQKNNERQKKIQNIGQDYKGHIKYQLGLRTKRIDWKLYSRTKNLMVKDFSTPKEIHRHYHFPYNLSSYNTSEDNLDKSEIVLSQICQWLHESFSEKEKWDLSVHGQYYANNQNKEDLIECLNQLAIAEKEK